MTTSVELEPSAVASLVEQYVAARSERLAHQHIVDKFKTEETRLKSVLIDAMLLTSQGVLASTEHSVTLRDRVEPSVVDWDQFTTYIRENDAFELLQRRPSLEGCRERWEAGEVIPGVSKYPVPNLSISTLKKGSAK